MPNTDTHKREQFTPQFAVAGFLVPGLGHVLRGETWRGIAIFAGVMWLWVAGLLVGGVDVIDHVDNKWWFLGQAAVGAPTFAVDIIHQKAFKHTDPVTGERRNITPDEARAQSGDPNARPPASESLAHMEEIGSLFGAIAGMMNLLCILDAAWRSRDRRNRESRRTGAPAPIAGAQRGEATA